MEKLRGKKSTRLNPKGIKSCKGFTHKKKKRKVFKVIINYQYPLKNSWEGKRCNMRKHHP